MVSLWKDRARKSSWSFWEICMNRHSTKASTLLLASLLAASASPAAAEESASMLAKSGNALFKEHCSSCHGISAKGDGPVASALKVQPADLTKIAERRGGEFPEAEIAATIDGRDMNASHGSREMPVWGRAFSSAFGGGSIGEEANRGRLEALLAYLRSIQRR